MSDLDLCNPDEQPAEKFEEGLAGTKTRQMHLEVLGIDIPPARCVTHLKNQLIPPQIAEGLKKLNEELKVYKKEEVPVVPEGEQPVVETAAETKKRIETVRAKHKDRVAEIYAEIAKTSIRISNDAPIAVATICNHSLREIINHAIQQTIAADRKIVEVHHIHSGSVKSLLTYPIWRNLPTIINYDAAYEDGLKKDRSTQNKTIKEEREVRKKEREEREKDGEKIEKLRKPRDPKKSDSSKEVSETTFITYVDKAFKRIRDDEQNKGMRVSYRIREYCSDLIHDLIIRLANIAKIIVQDVSGVRTLNADHIISIVKLFMIDEGKTADEFKKIDDVMRGKLADYKEHAQKEKLGKEEKMTDDEKMEKTAKKKLDDIKRKERELENAKTRAVELAAKAKKLQEDLSAK